MASPHSAAHPASHALARWLVLLMGWVWLGQQGQRLGWTVASGVLAVVLWWALRLLLGQRRWVHRLPQRAPVWLGAATAGGALGVASLPASPMAHALLLALAGVWACWSAALDVASAPARCPRRWAGWPPLLAAGLTGLAIETPGLWTAAGLHLAPGTAAAGVLLLAAWLQQPHTHAPRHAFHPTMHTEAAVLPHSAMGLMMGSLWLSSAWCATASWSPASVVGLHVLLMALLPALTRLDLLPRQVPHAVAHALPLALVLGGSLVLLWGPGLAHGITGMGLLALAWALHGERFVQPDPPTRTRHGLAQHSAALSGPALLLAVGWWSPTLGPQALQGAYGLLGAAALVALLGAAHRFLIPHPTPGETFHEQH